MSEMIVDAKATTAEVIKEIKIAEVIVVPCEDVTPVINDEHCVNNLSTYTCSSNPRAISPNWRDPKHRELSPSWRKPPSKDRKSASPNRRNESNCGSCSPNRRNEVNGGSRSPNWRNDANGGARSPNRRNEANGGSRSPNRRNEVNGGARSPNWRNDANGGARSPNRRNEANGGSRSPNRRNPSPNDGRALSPNWRKKSPKDLRSSSPNWRASSNPSQRERSRSPRGRGRQGHPSGGDCAGDEDDVEALDSSNFDSVLTSVTPWLVMFSAPWCGPCRKLKPAFHLAANKLKGKVRFGLLNGDLEQNEDLVRSFASEGFPSLYHCQVGQGLHLGLKRSRARCSVHPGVIIGGTNPWNAEKLLLNHHI